ncbi:heme peroxidase [Collybia nuda]|uniref:Heme peroxidase n=1 Tax=Collybia nuda TaxID=64659 RepID=A0A9P6CI08_9AGAR|nr:heme peroxidase [Collybia nuda]
MAGITPGKVLALGADTAFLATRDLPDAPDGYYDWQVSADPSDQRKGHSIVTNLATKVSNFAQKGGFQPSSGFTSAFLDAFTHPEAIDDRKGLFASGLAQLAKIDPNTDIAKKLNNAVIDTLYGTVEHPPATYMGPKYTFRQADGGGNNVHFPDIGRAGTPYARSVQGKAGLPVASLPDSGLVFDTILKRNQQLNHAGGMSSMIFAFASIVTHSLFRTDKDININNASSYLDLSPLYGDNQAAQNKVRDKAAGRGLMYPDTFSEERLLFAPPATSALLVVFSRNHNFIAHRILKINEKKMWSDPPPTDPTALALQDEQIFQTAKLINCGHFMSAIMGDYVAGFLGQSEGANWNMNAFDVIDSKDRQVSRGEGNHVSVEFNIMYRWHATMSQRDEEWTQKVFKKAFQNKSPSEVGLSDVENINALFGGLEADPSKRTFAGLSRLPDGRFADADIAKILHDATEAPAGSFRGQGTPEVLRIAEIMGMEQSRKWGLCTMNEFRKFLGLRQFESFEEWNSDAEIVKAARRLYLHIDNLELYTGLQAESTMPLSDGSRFCCGYTACVLGDAIALVRGDRFSTTDFTPTNFTSWGFRDCQRSLDNGAFGGQIPKLLLRNLPNQYPWNSVYSLFPFFTPSKMKTALKAQGIDAKYNFDRPVLRNPPVVLNDFTAIKYAFDDPSKFKIIYDKVGYGSVLTSDDRAQHDADRSMITHAFWSDKAVVEEYITWYGSSTTKQIKERGWTYPGLPGNYVDIVRDVINPVCVRFVTEKLFGIEPKTKDNKHQLYTEREFYDMLQDLVSALITKFGFVSRTFAFAWRDAATDAGLVIGGLAGKTFLALPRTHVRQLSGIIGLVAGKIAEQKSSYQFQSQIAASKRPIDELLGCILGLGVGASVNFAQSAVHVVNLYLENGREKERQQIIQLANSNDARSLELLRGYTREGMRLRPQFTGIWRDAAVDAEIPQGSGRPPLKVKAGDRIRASFKNAHLDPTEFPNPTTIDPTRPASSYNLNGAGFHNCPGTAFASEAITEIVKSIFKLKNLRRAPGNAGKLQGFTEIINQTETDYYIQRDGSVNFWPGSLQIVVCLFSNLIVTMI